MEQSTPHQPIQYESNDEIRQLLGNPPGWLLRWGMSFLLAATLVFLLIGWLVKYPDIIPARIVLITEQPPIRVVARTSGKINTFYVKDRSLVQQNQLLAMLDNTSTQEDVFALERLLDIVEQAEEPDALEDLQLPRRMNLGPMQATYSEFAEATENLQYLLTQADVRRKVRSLNSQIARLGDLNNSLKKQEALQRDEVKIALQNFERNQNLNATGNASDVEMEVAEAEYIRQKRLLENYQTDIINNKLKIEQLKLEKVALRQNRKDDYNDQLRNIKEAVRRLRSEIESWKQQFLIIAPITGKVSMSQVWSSQQFVQANEEILTIVPDSSAGGIRGRAVLPMEGSGKVALGMRVNIRLDNYPYKEYGILRGIVESISLVPEDGNYIVEVTVPNDLVTTYSEQLRFSQEMRGTANIITEERRIIERIFDSILSIVRNS